MEFNLCHYLLGMLKDDFLAIFYSLICAHLSWKGTGAFSVGLFSNCANLFFSLFWEVVFFFKPGYKKLWTISHPQMQRTLILLSESYQ